MISLKVAHCIDANGNPVRKIFWHGTRSQIEGWAQQNGLQLEKVSWLNGLDPIEVQLEQAQKLVAGVPFEELE